MTSRVTLGLWAVSLAIGCRQPELIPGNTEGEEGSSSTTSTTSTTASTSSSGSSGSTAGSSTGGESGSSTDGTGGTSGGQDDTGSGSDGTTTDPGSSDGSTTNTSGTTTTGGTDSEGGATTGAPGCAEACGGTTPICGEDGECRRCGVGDCSAPAFEDTPICHADGSCVECEDDDDCSSYLLPHCDDDTRECLGCTSSTQCAGRFLDRDTCQPGSGYCTECTAAEDQACGSDVCDVQLGECADGVPKASAGDCAPCLSEDHCEPGLTCVRTEFGDNTNTGYFCLWNSTGDCESTRRPYIGEDEFLGLETGLPTPVCTLRDTSCQGLNDFRDQKACVGSDDCGLGEGDTDCSELEGTHRCYYACGFSDDCPVGYDCVETFSPSACLPP